MKMKTLLVGLGLTAACSAGPPRLARTPAQYRDDTRALLATRSDAIRICYERVLGTTPDAGGRVSVTFDVEPERGRVVNVAIDAKATTAPPEVVRCVKENLYFLALSPRDARTGQGSFSWELTPTPPRP